MFSIFSLNAQERQSEKNITELNPKSKTMHRRNSLNDAIKKAGDEPAFLLLHKWK